MSGARLEARGLAVRRGERELLAPLDLALEPGHLTIVVGPNGAGKSTLVRALAGLVPADGVVALGGTPLTELDRRARGRLLGVFLELPDATFGFSARELVAMGRFPHVGRAFEGPEDVAAVDRALAALEVEALADRPYARLSSGERQRVALARVVAQDPAVWLLDEPTARLDPYHALRVARLAREVAASGRVVVAVEHDLDLAAQFGDRLLILSHGRLVADGPPATVLTPERIAEVYRVRARRVEGARPALVIDAD